jgi:hypothetical protein
MFDDGQGFFVTERALLQPVGGDIHDTLEASHAELLVNNGSIAHKMFVLFFRFIWLVSSLWFVWFL